MNTNGEIYEGHWSQNLRHGRGIQTWTNGRKYEGEFARDVVEGHGVYTLADGRQYEGRWVGGKLHGEAIFKKEGQDDRRGVWENGNRTKWLDESNVQLDYEEISVIVLTKCQLTIQYFQFYGMMEIPRMALWKAGVPYDEKLYTFDEWSKIKGSDQN
jgi:hypothetical protein